MVRKISKYLSVLLIFMFSVTPVFASDINFNDEDLQKEFHREQFIQEINKNLDLINEAIELNMQNISFVDEKSLNTFDVILSNGEISNVTITIEREESDYAVLDIDLYNTSSPVNDNTTYRVTSEIENFFGGSGPAGGRATHTFRFRTGTTGNNIVTPVTFVDTSMSATPPQFTLITGTNSTVGRPTNSSEITVDGYVGMQISGSWNTFINLYSELYLQSYRNSVAFRSNWRFL